MALDDDDIKQVVQVATKAVNDAMRPLGAKLAASLTESITKQLDDTIGEKLTAQQKRAAAESQKVEAPKEDEERKTLRQEVAELKELRKRDEAEKATLKKQAQEERENTAFRATWAKSKFTPDLADDHLAALRMANRMSQDEGGTIRVLDPKKGKHDDHPTLEEYCAELAASDRGKLYLPPGGKNGAGAVNGAAGQAHAKGYNPNALNILLGRSPDE